MPPHAQDIDDAAEGFEEVDPDAKAFKVACAHYKSAPELFSDEERLHLYALFKQATTGPAPSSLKVVAMGLLRGAELAAWRKLGEMPKTEARREYVHTVEKEGERAASKSDPPEYLKEAPPAPRPLARTSSWGAVGSWQADQSLLQTPLETLSRAELLLAARTLRERVQTLSVGRVMKAGELSRFRETLMGGDWAPRYFEVVPGFLRCYKSRKNRELRLEAPLTAETTVKREPDKRSRRAGERYIFSLSLGEAIACASRITEIRCSTGSRRDRDEWMAAIEASIALAAGPQAPPTPKNKKKRAKGDLGETTLLSRTVHRRARPSLLSVDSTDHQSYGGFVNLLAVVAVVSNSRALLNEWHSIPLVRAITKRVAASRVAPVAAAGWASIVPAEVAAAMSFVGLCLACAVVVERVSKSFRQQAPFHLLRALLVVATLGVPLCLMAVAESRPGPHGLALLFACTAMMKVLSYVHTNAQLGERFRALGSKSPKGAPTPRGVFASNDYPTNLTFWNMAEFVAFPTLVYQTEYPRTACVRKRWLFKRVCELVFVVLLMLLIVTQFVKPTVTESLAPVRDLNLLGMLERLFALAIPVLFVWILIFVLVFELWLSILAEVTRFGDRLFYRDWWNARKFDDYWRLWNLPVHNWLLRHIFFPCLNLGLGRPAATAMVFLVSASLHELLISAPCHLVRLYAFAGMMTQVPLIQVTNFIHEKMPYYSRAGNVLFWVVFCIVGQPMALMLYFHDTQNGGMLPGAGGSLRGEL